MCRPVFHRSQAPQTMTTILLSVAEQLHLVISGGFLRVIGGGSVPLWAKSRRLIGEHCPPRHSYPQRRPVMLSYAFTYLSRVRSTTGSGSGGGLRRRDDPSRTPAR